MKPLLSLVLALSLCNVGTGASKPLRHSKAIWPHLDNGCKPMMLLVSVVDLDAFPVWRGGRIPKTVRIRLRGEAKKTLEAVDLYSNWSSGELGDDYDPLLIVELDISLDNKVFFSSVKYQRSFMDKKAGQRIRATVWFMQDYGSGLYDPEVAVTKTVEIVKRFVSRYLAMNECDT